MKTILVVDEDSKVKNLFRLMFTEGMGYRVVAISSPTEAILKAKETKPDVVFVNASSSNQNGYRILKEIKNKRLLKDIPVVLLTQASLPPKEKEILESRADDIIAKPFEPQEIIKKVESLTTKQKEQLQTPVDQEVKRKTAFFEIGVVLLVILTITIPIIYKAFDINSSKVQSTLNSLYSKLMNFGDINTSTVESKPVTYDERKKEVIYDIKNEDSEKSELNTNVVHSSKASSGESSVKKGEAFSTGDVENPPNSKKQNLQTRFSMRLTEKNLKR
jgi:Response regulator containing a CheY-like receiver domain and a GGDEF domain